MGPQIIVSAHAPVDLKPHKLGLRYAILEAVCFGVLNETKDQFRKKQ